MSDDALRVPGLKPDAVIGSRASTNPPWPEGRDVPHGWLQWKGTNVCMDFRCTCGALTHLDADFAYAVICGACGAAFELNPHVRAHPIDLAQWQGCEPRVTEGDGGE